MRSHTCFLQVYCRLFRVFLPQLFLWFKGNFVHNQREIIYGFLSPEGRITQRVRVNPSKESSDKSIKIRTSIRRPNALVHRILLSLGIDAPIILYWKHLLTGYNIDKIICERLYITHLSFLKAIKSLTRSQRAVNELRCSSTSSFLFFVSFGSFLTFSPKASVSIIWGVFSSTSLENICRKEQQEMRLTSKS